MILLIDKDPISADSIEYYLEAEGFEISTLFDSSIAAAEVRRLDPDLVLLEIILSGTNGLSLCSSLKQDATTAQVPVIVMSVLDADERARQAGADEFLLKPVDRQELVATVYDVLDSYKGSARVR